MTQSANPLQAYFRRPVIYIKLPSDGQFWPPGSLDMTPNRELPVLPMTAIDEITYRTPDALFNGAATVSVIQSCIPNIKNAWNIPNCDLNAVLTAIRIASYGKNMPVGTSCPSCNTDNEYELNLQTVMDSLQLGDYSQTVRHGDLEIFFQPMTYENQTQINLLTFEQQRVINMAPESDLTEEEKTQRINEAIRRITEITAQAIRNTIKSIRTPQALVTDPVHIQEFLLNCDRNFYNQIRDHAIKLRQSDEFKPLDLKCPSCQHEYKQQFTLDTANFFDNAS